MGARVAQVLAAHFSDIDQIMEADHTALASIDGIGPTIAESIWGYFQVRSNREMVQRLRDAGLSMSLDKGPRREDREGVTGKSFVFTGTLERLTRDEAMSLVTSLGGKAVSSVSSRTDYVVVGAEPGSKYEKALHLGVKVLTESEFMELTGR